MSLEETFEIERTLAAIQQGSYKKVALQFPDELLPQSTSVALRLKALAPDVSFFVLADTTYGPCCVDEVAAEHVLADLVVHYGRACLGRVSRVACLYVFGHASLDVTHCATALTSLMRTIDPDQGTNAHILLLFDTPYQWASENVYSALKEAGFSNVVPSHINAGVDAGSLEKTSSYGRKYTLPDGKLLSQYAIVFIGGESLTLTNIIMTHSGNQSYSYDPVAKVAREESSAVNKMLRRRYVMVQKAKDAGVIGIVVGTLGVVSYLPLIEHLKKLITACGKKPYLIAVGKPSPAKLGNFLEIEAFVLVACPENTLVDSKEFMQPIVTPFELEIALVRGKEWTGQYETDLTKLAERIGLEADEELQRKLDLGSEDEDDEPHFSLMTGGYKSRKQYGDVEETQDAEAGVDGETSEGAVLLRNPAGAVSKFVMNSAAGDFLNSKRTFKGLEVKLGETAAGVASGYSEEGNSAN
ncbi:Diphthamide biosynthesis protein 2 [Chytriomyces hyalinus]|nr:Diphthamide biosynthesis protein 2 [Chytriomyces hyalinus]